MGTSASYRPKDDRTTLGGQQPRRRIGLIRISYSGELTSDSDAVGIAVHALLFAEGERDAASVSEKSARRAIRTIGCALQHIPNGERARWAEEWASDLDSITGPLRRWRWRIGLRMAGHRMRVPSLEHDQESSR